MSLLQRLFVSVLVVLALVLAAISPAAAQSVADQPATDQPDTAQSPAEQPAAADTTEVGGEVSVASLGFGTDVDRTSRSLVGAAETFPADVDRVYCLTRIIGATTPTEIAHVWYHEGEMMARVDLSVGSADWRTYSSKAILPEWQGSWEVTVLDATGNIIGSGSFTIH
jgi:hypothetical protein